MKTILIFMLLFISSINLLANTLNKPIWKNWAMYTIKKNENNVSIIERIDKNGKSVLWEPSSFITKLHTIFVDDSNVYLVCSEFGTNSFYKIKNEDNLITKEKDLIEIYPPIRPSSSFYGFNFEMVDDKIMISIVGNKKWIKKATNYNNYFYEDKEKLWFPKDNNGSYIYEEARSAIRVWFYDGKLKRWYPENRYGEYNKDVWTTQTPSDDIVKIAFKLRQKVRNGENVDYFAEFTKIFKREKERNLFLKSINIESSKEIQNENISNNENYVKNIVETENPKSKIVIILAILLTIIFGGFLIKNGKKKKIIKNKNI